MRIQKTSNNRIVNAWSMFNWSRVRWMAASVLAGISLCLSPHLTQAQGRPDIVWQGAHSGFLRYTTFSPDSQQLASGGDDKTNKLWQASNGSLVRSFAQCGGPGCGGPLFGFYSPDSQTLATSGIKFWRVSDGTLLRTLSVGGNIAFSPDWQYVASSVTVSTYPSENRSIKLLRVADGSQVWAKTDSGGGQVLFSPDGQTLAAVGFQGIDMWRVSDGAFLRNIPGPRTLLAFTPDGQSVVTSGGAGGSYRYDDTIKFYRISDGALIRTLTATGIVTSVAFTPDGQTMLSGSGDVNNDPVNGFTPETGSVRFWRVSDGALLKTYDQDTGRYAVSVAVSPDGQFFSYAHESTVVVARMPTLSCAFSISPTRADLPASGGNGSVAVTAPDGCSWRAVSRVGWINITSGSTGTGNGTVTYQTTASGDDITGLLIIAEQAFPVHLGTPSCSYTVTSNGTTFSANGGTGSLGVQTPTGCGWSASSNTDWITITKIKNNSGGGLTYAVAPNSGPARSGTITIAGQTVTINQVTAPCTYTVTPTSNSSYDSAGGSGSANVSAIHGCPWTVTTDASWITLSATSGDGDGAASYWVNANNTTSTRTGHVTIAGQTFTITQTGITCNITISPLNRSFAADGGSAYVNVDGQDACGWTATSNADWVNITSGASGSGYGTVSYTVAPYSGTTPRSGTITVADQTFTVYQGTELLQGSPDIVWTGSGHTASANAVAFSPDGQLLASASSDHTVKVWRVSDGALLRTLTGFFGSVTCVTFSHNGQMLVAGDNNSVINVWSVSDFSLIRTLSNPDFVFGVAFSPNDQTLAVAGGYSGNWIRLWRVSDWQQTAILGYGQSQNTSIAYSPDGQFLASGQLNSLARLQNLSSGLVRTLGHQTTVNAVAFSSDSQLLATGSTDQSVSLWHVTDGARLYNLNGPSGSVKAVSFSPDNQMVIAGGQDYGASRGTILFWRVADGSLIRTYIQQTSSAVNSIQYSPNGNLFAYARADGLITVARNPFSSSTAAPRARVSNFDGDAMTDVAIWRPATGDWIVSNSSNGATQIRYDWGRGSLGDLLVPGDYDGDGKTDIAVFRPSEGNWYIIRSSNATAQNQGWGAAGDKPVPGDYDGDGKTDIAVWRPSDGNWYIINSSTGNASLQGWGGNGDKPVPGDYDGDGRTDLAVFRPAEGNWYIINSATGAGTVRNWGNADEVPVPGDYDGDGKTDIAVWRPVEGTWYIIRSSTGTGITQYLGGTGDIPVAAAYIPQ